MSPDIYDVSPTLIRCKADESSTTNTPISRPLCANKQNVASRYLSAPTGSCHDACKYGKSHEFKDTKPWRSRRRVSAPPLNNKNNADIQIFVDKKVKNGVKTDEVKHSPANEKNKKVSPSWKKTPLVDSKNIKQEGNSSSKRSSYSAPKMVTTPSQPERKKNTREGRSSSNGTSKMVKKVVQSAQTLKTPTQSNQNKNVTRMKSSSSPNPTKSKEKRMNEPKTTNARVSRVAPKKIPTPLTVTSPLRRKSRVETDPNLNLRSTCSKMEKKMKSLENNKQISRALNEEGEDNMRATLNETECIQSLCPLPGESPNSSSQTYPISFTSHEIDTEFDDSVSSSDGLTLGFEDGEDPKSVKLKFRRGKVIEPESESKREMKVKFKQERILETKQEVNGGLRRKSYRKRATGNLKRESKPAIAEVVLKHQDVEMKKEEQVLLNNVIEQTANKLVVTKKSKVKALVGAFETVISLQERKSSGADR